MQLNSLHEIIVFFVDLNNPYLTCDHYILFYLVRSLSIQNAYEDMNSYFKPNLKVNVMASAFARNTFGGNCSQYLGDVSVYLNNMKFDVQQNISSGSNMHMYFYHTYGKTGHLMNGDLSNLISSINNPAIVPVITEHNSKTSSNWNLLSTNPGTPSEASLLA
jgi:hypothetical protein